MTTVMQTATLTRMITTETITGRGAMRQYLQTFIAPVTEFLNPEVSS
jgi:hypothetical protein